MFNGGVSGTVPCCPPNAWATSAQAGGYAGVANFQAAIGLAFGTGAITPPSTTQPSRGFMAVEGNYRFRVVPDDPLSTDPVELEITTRHRFGADSVSISGAGSASNSYRAYYAVEPMPITGLGFPADWDSEGVPVVSEGFFDLVETIVVPVHQDMVFRTWHQQQSFACSGSQPGSSASASLSSFSTFEFDTDAPATIVFAYEDELGLPPPQLDVVPEPALGAALGPALVLLASLSRSPRGRGQSPALSRRAPRLDGRAAPRSPRAAFASAS